MQEDQQVLPADWLCAGERRSPIAWDVDGCLFYKLRCVVVVGHVVDVVEPMTSGEFHETSFPSSIGTVRYQLMTLSLLSMWRRRKNDSAFCVVILLSPDVEFSKEGYELMALDLLWRECVPVSGGDTYDCIGEVDGDCH